MILANERTGKLSSPNRAKSQAGGSSADSIGGDWESPQATLGVDSLPGLIYRTNTGVPVEVADILTKGMALFKVPEKHGIAVAGTLCINGRGVHMEKDPAYLKGNRQTS